MMLISIYNIYIYTHYRYRHYDTVCTCISMFYLKQIMASTRTRRWPVTVLNRSVSLTGQSDCPNASPMDYDSYDR